MQYLRHQKLCSGFGYIRNFSIAVSPLNAFFVNFNLQMLRLNKASVLRRKQKQNCLIALLSFLGKTELTFHEHNNGLCKNY